MEELQFYRDPHSRNPSLQHAMGLNSSIQIGNEEHFLPAETVPVEIMKANIQRYLGPTASARPATYNGQAGYFIKAPGKLDHEMEQDLSERCEQWWNREGESIGQIGTQMDPKEFMAHSLVNLPRFAAMQIPTLLQVSSTDQTRLQEPTSQAITRPQPSVADRMSPSESNSSDDISIEHDIDVSTSSLGSAIPVGSPQDTNITDEGNDTDDLDSADMCGWQPGLEKFLWDDTYNETLITERRLGKGSIGEVDEVRQPGYEHTMARKRICLSRRVKLATRELELIKNEVAAIKSLRHPHIIRIIGSYQTAQGSRNHIVNLLLLPVGDNDLANFLDDASKWISENPFDVKTVTYKDWISKWFLCLISALAYMHSQKIIHEDIKPKNIIHKQGNIYFTDFSSSRKFEAGQETSTANPARASRLFAAPEALPSEDGTILRHGSRTDVFSLGLVFVEMLTVLSDRDIDGLHEFLEETTDFGESWEYRQYHRGVGRFEEWFADDVCLDFYIEFVAPMLVKERKCRPSADDGLRRMKESYFKGEFPSPEDYHGCPCLKINESTEESACGLSAISTW